MKTTTALLIRCLLAVLWVVGCFGPTPARAAQPTAGKRSPNVILILADDFGYECVGANGGTSYRTPNLDKLAATGMRFMRCQRGGQTQARGASEGMTYGLPRWRFGLVS